MSKPELSPIGKAPKAFDIPRGRLEELEAAAIASKAATSRVKDRASLTHLREYKAS